MGSLLGDRYELIRHIARGGMGDVYEATDRRLRRNVAVKIYRAASPADRSRFDAEVRILAGLDHPGLVRVFDAGPHGDDAYVVLELVGGPPLSQAVGDGVPLPHERVAELGAALADALAHIHARGVVHRDVTPANVLCDDEGRPRLVDFGIVRLLGTERMTSASVAVGTAAYMAPEQVQGHDVTPAADVYSLGLVLLELLTGRRQFVGSVQEVAVARLVRDPDTSTGVPPVWHSLLGRMCARRPADRPAAAEVSSALAALGADSSAAAPMAALIDPAEDEPTTALLTVGLASAGGPPPFAPTQPISVGTEVHSQFPFLLDPPAMRAPGRAAQHRKALWLAAAGIVVALAVARLAGDGFGSQRRPASDTTTTTTVASDARGTTVVPTTQAAPQVVPDGPSADDPAKEPKGNGRGKNKAAD